jgi:hypothetical protein
MKALLIAGALCAVLCSPLAINAWNTYDFMHPFISGVELEDGKLYVYYRKASPWVYPEGGGPPDSVWRDVYCARDAQIHKCRREDAEVKPEHTTPETLEWPRD